MVDYKKKARDIYHENQQKVSKRQNLAQRLNYSINIHRNKRNIGPNISTTRYLPRTPAEYAAARQDISSLDNTARLLDDMNDMSSSIARLNAGTIARFNAAIKREHLSKSERPKQFDQIKDMIIKDVKLKGGVDKIATYFQSAYNQAEDAEEQADLADKRANAVTEGSPSQIEAFLLPEDKPPSKEEEEENLFIGFLDDGEEESKKGIPLDDIAANDYVTREGLLLMSPTAVEDVDKNEESDPHQDYELSYDEKKMFEIGQKRQAFYATETSAPHNPGIAKKSVLPTMGNLVGDFDNFVTNNLSPNKAVLPKANSNHVLMRNYSPLKQAREYQNYSLLQKARFYNRKNPLGPNSVLMRKEKSK